MLSLEKLQGMIAPAPKKRVPSVKRLEESGAKVAAEIVLSDGSTLCVYDSGYVLYKYGRHTTVFRLHDVGDGYMYSTVEEVFRPDMYISRLGMMLLPWYIAVMMYADDRMTRIIEKNAQMVTPFYYGPMISTLEGRKEVETGTTPEIEERVDEINMAVHALSVLNDLQREIITQYFYDGKQQKEIAADRKVSNQAVNIVYKRSLNKMCKALKAGSRNKHIHRRNDSK